MKEYQKNAKILGKLGNFLGSGTLGNERARRDASVPLFRYLFIKLRKALKKSLRGHSLQSDPRSEICKTSKHFLRKDIDAKDG